LFNFINEQLRVVLAVGATGVQVIGNSHNS